MKEFLHTFNKNCSDNVEYSEWSYESLFQCLEHYPETFIQVLTSEEVFDTTYISELGNSG